MYLFLKHTYIVQTGMILLVLYFESSWYACLKDGSGSAQPLLDTDFPDLSARGRAVSLGVYDHSYFDDDDETNSFLIAQY